MDQINQIADANPIRRDRLGLWVIMLCGAGMSTLAVISLWIGVRTSDAESRYFIITVFNAIVPIFGTWIGTVIAFYFSRENFDAAARNTRALYQQLGESRLQEISVERAWIPFRAIEGISLVDKTESDISIEQLKNKLSDKVSRVPIFDSNRSVKFIIHESMIYKYVAELSLAREDVMRKTLADFLKHGDFRSIVTKIAWISKTSTLADAKSAMTNVEGCQDVFVTLTGQSVESVLGWITNIEIAAYSKA
jgi:hypothetical protein